MLYGLFATLYPTSNRQLTEIIVKKVFISSVLVLGLFATVVTDAAVPDLVLNDLNGKPRSVSEFIGKGKWTVVMLWAHNCPICNQEVDQMSFFHDDHKDKDATVLGVSVDGSAQVDKARRFVENHAIEFPNLIVEPRQQQIGKFGGGQFIGTPTFYVFSPDGELAAKQVGPVTQEDLEAFMARSQQAAR